MYRSLRNFFLSLFPIVSCLLYGEGYIAQANGIEIWYETFGSSKDPAFVLMMGGGGCQGVLWPVDFCEKLAQKGFYVIRYDNRDAGFSTCFDFHKSPYTLLDITKDTVGLLDHLKIQKAHFFGVSMGGLVAKIMAAYYPERTISIAFMASTCDVRPMNLALQGLPPEEGLLSSPFENYLAAIQQVTKNASKTEEGELEQRVAIWHMMSGSKIPFDKDFYRSLHKECLLRTKRPDVLMNHFLCSALSEELVRQVPSQITVPALIIQGSEDPVFRPDHGEALAKAIPGSTYVFVKDLGHVPNKYFDEFFIEVLTKHACQDKWYYTLQEVKNEWVVRY